NGVGRATFFDSEPERVTIELRSADGRIAPTTISFIVKLDLVPDIPALATVSDGIDTIFFRTYDGTSTLYPYTSPTPACSVVIIEQFPNGSVSLNSPQVILRDGIGYILIEDTEPESVWVTLLVYDEYLSTEFETGTIYFSSTGIAENLKPLFSIKPPYPNPFNSFVVIPVEGYANEVTFEIYNALGERIKSVYSGAVNGRTRLVWNGRDENDSPVPSGLYFYKVTQGEHIYTGRLVYLK
ncbi:MAG: T9SS type A sorting domain-containing protein, partial [bacterium]